MLVDVAPVLELARSDRLFAPESAIAPADDLLITDFKLAHRYATEQPAQYGMPWSDWTDLREHQASGARGAAMGQVADEISVAVGKRLKLLGYERADNEVSADLLLIARARAQLGVTHSFWERLFKIYEFGLWPCGWSEGEYPDGRLVVFRPGAKGPGGTSWDD